MKGNPNNDKSLTKLKKYNSLESFDNSNPKSPSGSFGRNISCSPSNSINRGSPGPLEFTASAGVLTSPRADVDYFSLNTASLTLAQKLAILTQLGFTDTLKNMVELISRNKENLEQAIHSLLRDKSRLPLFTRFATKGVSKPSSLKQLPLGDEAADNLQLEIMRSRGFKDDAICLYALQTYNADKACEVLIKLNYGRASDAGNYYDDSERMKLLVDVGFSMNNCTELILGNATKNKQILKANNGNLDHTLNVLVTEKMATKASKVESRNSIISVASSSKLIPSFFKITKKGETKPSEEELARSQSGSSGSGLIEQHQLNSATNTNTNSASNVYTTDSSTPSEGGGLSRDRSFDKIDMTSSITQTGSTITPVTRNFVSVTQGYIMNTSDEEVFVLDEPGETQKSKLDRIRAHGFFHKAKNIDALEACGNNVDKAVTFLLKARFKKKENLSGLKNIEKPIPIDTRRSVDSARNNIPFFIPAPLTRKNIIAPDNIFDDESIMLKRNNSNPSTGKGNASIESHFSQLRELNTKGFLNTKVNKQILDECGGSVAKSIDLLSRHGYKPDIKGKRIIFDRKSESSIDDGESYLFPFNHKQSTGFLSKLLDWRKHTSNGKESAQVIAANSHSKVNSLDRNIGEAESRRSSSSSAASGSASIKTRKKASFSDENVIIIPGSSSRKTSEDITHRGSPKTSAIKSPPSASSRKTSDDINQRSLPLNSPPAIINPNRRKSSNSSSKRSSSTKSATQSKNNIAVMSINFDLEEIEERSTET